MKKRVSIFAVIGIAVCAVLGVSFAAYAAWTSPDGVKDNEITTGSATLSSIGGTAFAVTDLIPYDQPAGAGTRVAVKAYEVTVGDDAASVSLRVENLAGDLAGKLYYKVTSAAAEAPADTAGWTELADGALTGAQAIAESGTYYVNIILVTSDTADAGKTATFDVVLDIAGGAVEEA